MRSGDTGLPRRRRWPIGLTFSVLPVMVPGLVMLPSIRFSVKPEPVAVTIQEISLDRGRLRTCRKGIAGDPEPKLNGRGASD